MMMIIIMLDCTAVPEAASLSLTCPRAHGCRAYLHPIVPSNHSEDQDDDVDYDAHLEKSLKIDCFSAIQKIFRNIFRILNQEMVKYDLFPHYHMFQSISGLFQGKKVGKFRKIRALDPPPFIQDFFLQKNNFFTPSLLTEIMMIMVRLTFRLMVSWCLNESRAELKNRQNLKHKKKHKMQNLTQTVRWCLNRG